MSNKKITAVEWIERARSKNLEWVGEPPKRADAKTSIRCLACNYTWDVQPNGLRRVSRCPECQRAAGRVSHDAWVQRLRSVDATWLSETPNTLSDKSKSAQCSKCGQTWEVDPRSLYTGRGHPLCLKSKPQRKRTTNWEEYAATLSLRFLEMPRTANAKVPVECLVCGLVWSKRPFDIKNGSGCPTCARKRNRKSSRRISEVEWEERAQRAGLEWVDGAPQNAHAKTRVRCALCGFEFEAFPTNVTRGHGCARCAGNSLSVTELTDRATKMNIKLLDTPTYAISKVDCQCETCGHIWQVALKTISRGVGCPACAIGARREKRRMSDERLDELGAKLGFTWLEYPRNSQTPASAKCNLCGHIWMNRSSSASKGSACPQCAGRYVSEDTWNHRAAVANIVWLDTPAGARIPTPARCLLCGLEWKANPGHISKGAGCPGCAEYGFNFKKPALVYFLTRGNGIHGRAARKIGITNVTASKNRLAGFEKLGFHKVKTWEFVEGSVAAGVEYEVLSWIRNEIGLPQELDREELPIGGATETFTHGSVSDSEMIEKIDAVAQRHLRIK